MEVQDYMISLRAARVNAEMNQTEASKAIGVNINTLVKWETGKSKIDAISLRKLCKLYGVPESLIFLGDGLAKS